MTKSTDYFSDDALREDLKGKTVRGGVYTGGAQAVQTVIQLAAVPMLSRLLTPGDFGLVAMVTVVIGFGGMFVDAGLSMATVQRDRITREQVTNLFWVAATLGLLIALTVAATSPAIAWFYGERRLIPITLALTSTFICSGLTLQHQALLQRGMRFRALAIVQTLSVLVGQAVAIIYAWYYRTYWALVWMPIAIALTRAVGTWIACGWRPGLPRRGTGVRPMISFGAYLTGSNFINYFARNMDNVLIGRYWGATSLGYYERAYRLLLLPFQKINGPVSSVAVPALSRLRNQPDRYRSFFRKGVRLTAFAQVPVIVLAFVVTEDIILTFLGNQWLETIPIFQALLPAALISITAPASGWVYLSWGHTDRLVKSVVVNSAFILLGFAVGLPYGPFGVALSFSIATCVLRIPAILYCFWGTPLKLRDMGAATWHPMTAAVCAGIPVHLLVSRLDGDLAAPLRLLLATAVFGVAYLVCYVLIPGGWTFLREAAALIKPLKPHPAQ